MSSQNDDWTVLTGCFHSFHNTCFDGLNSCPLCNDFLKEKVQELGQTGKQAILNSSTEVPAVSQDNRNEGSDSGLNSSTETSTAGEMEPGEFENTIRQLHHEVFIQLHNHYQFPAITKDSQELPTQVKPLLGSLHTAENATIPFVDTKYPMVHRLNATLVPTMSAQ